MITLGLDPHPGSHTVVALDVNGSLLGSVTVLNTPLGISQLHLFAAQFTPRRWAIKGADNHFIVSFVNELLRQEETAYPVSPNLTSQYCSRRGRKKNGFIGARRATKAGSTATTHPGTPQ